MTARHLKLSRLSEERANQLQILLEQIEGAADLLLSHLDIAADKGAMTAVSVIKEKARAADALVRADLRPRV